MENEPPWILLTEAVDLAHPNTIARWCRDGQLETRAQRRVSHIRDYETGCNETHNDECHTLDPADWTENALGNPNGPHWQGNDAHYDFSTAPISFGLSMALTGGGFYAIQVRGDQLRERVERRKRSSADLIAAFPAAGQPAVVAQASGIGRAPSVKAGRPPSDDEILSKADEMKARGMDGRTIAKQMRLEPGFENVATTVVRGLIRGRWKPAGRPKKAA